MKNLRIVRQKLLRNLFKGLSLASVAFVFQACYGTPHGIKGWDGAVSGVVTNADKEPIQGIKVSINDSPEYEITDSNGCFSMYTGRNSNLLVKFEDVDGENNGSYLSKDTTIDVNRDEIFINISLDAAQ